MQMIIIVSSGFTSDENQMTMSLIEATDVDTARSHIKRKLELNGIYSINENGLMGYITAPDCEAKVLND